MLDSGRRAYAPTAETGSLPEANHQPVWNTGREGERVSRRTAGFTAGLVTESLSSLPRQRSCVRVCGAAPKILLPRLQNRRNGWQVHSQPRVHREDLVIYFVYEDKVREGGAFSVNGAGGVLPQRLVPTPIACSGWAPQGIHRSTELWHEGGVFRPYCRHGTFPECPWLYNKPKGPAALDQVTLLAHQWSTSASPRVGLGEKRRPTYGLASVPQPPAHDLEPFLRDWKGLGCGVLGRCVTCKSHTWEECAWLGLQHSLHCLSTRAPSMSL